MSEGLQMTLDLRIDPAPTGGRYTTYSRKQRFDPQDVPLRDLFPPRFMSAHTAFGSIGEMLRAVADEDPSMEAWRAAFHSRAWEEHVRKTTCFESWSAMRAAAAAQLGRRGTGKRIGRARG